MRILLLGFIGMCLLGLCLLVILMATSSSSSGTSQSSPTSPADMAKSAWPPQPEYVVLPNGRKYKPAWPWKPGMDPPGVPSEAYKWKFVSGLETKHGLNDMPNTPEDESWNPFATPGQKVVDEGIMVPIGDLPSVNPPAKYAKAPYMMRAMWQEGSTETNDYYKKHCTHLVMNRGKLHYFGPGKRAVGGYAWRYKGPTDQYGNMKDGLGGVSTQPFEAELYGGIDENHIMTILLQGTEVHPWFRRGPLSKNALPVFKKWCKPHIRADPDCEHPNEIGFGRRKCGS